MIAIAVNFNEISEHWNWLNQTLMLTLISFEHADEVTKFVLTKIEGLVTIGGVSTVLSLNSNFLYFE